MALFQILAVLIVLSAIFAYLNHTLIKLPMTIGVMIIALFGSIGLLAAGEFEPRVSEAAARLLSQIEFDEAVLHGLLAFLLFAGALQVNLNDLGSQKVPVLLLATLGVIASTAIVGGLTYGLLLWLVPGVSLLYCLLFGALISPTDPVAVLAIVRKAGAPKPLAIKIAGESLFNDGMGLVIFLSILGFTRAPEEMSAMKILSLFAVEALGGIVLGLVLGVIAYFMLKSVDNYQVEVLITLALAMGGYSLAETVHVSAPLAVVCAGLLIGNHGRAFAMSETVREHLDVFWELVDEILNVVLFALIGLELLIMPKEPLWLAAGGAAVVIVLLARWASVASMVKLLSPWRTFSRGAIAVLTWSGMRGAISVALALSLPIKHGSIERDVILAITYCVVVFSIIVQGLTVAPLVKRLARREAASPEPATSVA